VYQPSLYAARLHKVLKRLGSNHQHTERSVEFDLDNGLDSLQFDIVRKVVDGI
jgi:hypothetical protein